MVCNFPTEQRAAEIAAQRCKHYGYGLATTQACQASVVRYVQTHDCTAYEAALLIVRAPFDAVPGVVA